MIHSCTRPAPVGSSGCCARNSGAVAIVATTSPPATPAATHSHEGSRVNASRAINTAAPSATNGMPSMPLGTQYAALVDLAIVTASANTSTADQRVEAGTAARLQECAARIVGDESYLAAATRHLCGHRGGEAHRIFDGRLLALADVHLAIEVEKDPDVGGQWLLESLRHEPVVVSRKRPVDAAEAVACHVVAHPAGLRRVVGPRTGRRRRTEVLRAGGHQVRDGTDARVYEY